MRRAAPWAVLPIWALVASTAASTASEAPAPAIFHPLQSVRDSFPHLEHEGLFPLCEGCHQGIPVEDEVRAMPGPELCAECHDGVERDRVEWVRPIEVTGLLDFAHDRHVEEVRREGAEPVPCSACHIDPDRGRMALVPLQAERCLECHEVPVDRHLDAANECADCHRPIAEVEDGDEVFRGIPERLRHRNRAFFDAHEGRDFILRAHGGEALASEVRCATCHVEDQCAGCHVDAGLSPIPEIPRAPAGWDTPLLPPEYPEPETHRAPEFGWNHGAPAPDAADCSTCHTREDCQSCHLTPAPSSARELPRRPDVRAPGVGLEASYPASHDTPFFLSMHTVAAATSPDSCAGCHTESYCSECHDAPQAPAYHPPSFALRHSAAVGSQSAECANCHNTAAFCRECHVEVGLRSVGRLGTGYHDAEPVWLLRHPIAARQGMEQCASCHTQNDCLQCHSELGAFKVSPHGPDFDPERARAKNPLICRACHLAGSP